MIRPTNKNILKHKNEIIQFLKIGLLSRMKNHSNEPNERNRVLQNPVLPINKFLLVVVVVTFLVLCRSLAVLVFFRNPYRVQVRVQVRVRVRRDNRFPKQIGAVSVGTGFESTDTEASAVMKKTKRRRWEWGERRE